MIVPVTYYTVECDGCGTDLLEDHEMSAWSDPCWALEMAEMSRVENQEGLVAIACADCRAEYRDEAVSEHENERMLDGEFWATWAFRGWLRWKRAIDEGVFV